jgi:tRNA (cytidine/uridine-2'-O-)-methyltransferase
MLHIVLYQPEIPPNTGNVMRLASNTGFFLHLIEPLGFTLEEKSLRRAGLDYRDLSRVAVHSHWEAFLQHYQEQYQQPPRVFAISTKGTRSVFETQFKQDDVIVFGSETSGLPQTFRDALPADQVLRIPMQENNRSLNLSNAVAIVAYEAWRQLGFTSK